MKRIFSLILAALFILPFFTACRDKYFIVIPDAHATDAPYPIFIADLEPISDEMIEEVKQAFYDLKYAEEYERIYSARQADPIYSGKEDQIKQDAAFGADRSAKNYVSYFFSESKDDHFVGRYYGTVNNCVILARSTYLENEYNTVAVGGNEITNSHSFYLFAYRDGRIETLEKAYSDGWLKDKDIKIIKIRHELFNSCGYWKDESEIKYHYARFTPELEEISAELIAEIIEANRAGIYREVFDGFLKMIGTDTTVDVRSQRESAAMEAHRASLGAEKLFTSTDEESFRYYGIFGEKVVWANVSAMTSITEFTFAGYDFYYSTLTDVNVYVTGENMSLLEAYDKGLFTEDEIALLHARCLAYEEYLKSPSKEPVPIKAQSTEPSATTEEQTVPFNITPAQDSIISDIFGSSYAAISGKWSYWFEKSLTAEDASVWNTEAPSDIFDVLGYLSNNDRFYRVWTATPSLSSDAKMEYIIVSPEQDSIITELVDEKYKCYAGYWDIWFYKILNSKQIDDWNFSEYTTHDTIRQFMQDKSIATKLESHVPIYEK